jgi:NADH-quinone oxidoreductase subunit L
VFGGALYDLVYNKYYVDEIYNALVIQPYLALCFACAWFDLHIIDGFVNLMATLVVITSWISGLIDTYIVDGLVNLASNETLAIGGRLRRLQTGSINGYLYGILAGVMIILLVRAMFRA